MEDALARRERLKALKQAAELIGDKEEEEPEPARPILKFRNYQVHDKKIEHEQVAPAHPPKFEAPVVTSRPEDADQEDLLVSVAPKKANFDLKRELAPKLDKLERRTQRALVEIFQEQERQRLEAEGFQD